MTEITESKDVVVIGAGIGGLSCAALLARYGYKVSVFESHSVAGGCAHGFEVDGFHFDSGPSFFSGLEMENSFNPLKQVLDAVGESVKCVKYTGFQMLIPEGTFRCVSDPAGYREELRRFTNDRAVAEFDALLARMKTMSHAVEAVPSMALRMDGGALVTALPFLGRALRAGREARYLNKPFAALVNEEVQHPFVRNVLSLEAFMLGGLTSEHTVTAEMAFMFTLRERAPIDYPIGGSQAIVDALVRGIEKWGGEVHLGAHVERIVVEDGRARGVEVRRKGVVRADVAVVSNASIWDTLRLLPEDALKPGEWQARDKTKEVDSFMHLHLGIDGKGLEGIGIHHIVMDDWNIERPQNVVGISIPSAVDPSLAPAGHHVIHAYTPATEPYDLWVGLKRGTPEYEKLKEERSQVLWRALERIIPDVRARAKVTMVGTPLTHKRFLRRHRGSYGVAFRAGDSTVGKQLSLKGLHSVGDSFTPGIGVPAAAMSGMLGAHAIVPVKKHARLLATTMLPAWARAQLDRASSFARARAGTYAQPR